MDKCRETQESSDKNLLHIIYYILVSRNTTRTSDKFFHLNEKKEKEERVQKNLSVATTVA